MVLVKLALKDYLNKIFYTLLKLNAAVSKALIQIKTYLLCRLYIQSSPLKLSFGITRHNHATKDVKEEIGFQARCERYKAVV